MPYTRCTLAELDKRLWERLDLHPYYTVQDRYDALRMALKIWQAATGVWRTSVSANAIAGDPYIPVPGLVHVTGVRWNDAPLLPTTIQELDFARPNWRNEQAGTTGQTTLPKYWASIGLTTVAIWPTPPTTQTVTCLGLDLPPSPTPGATLVAIDVADFWIDGLVDLAAWWATGKATQVEQSKFQPHFVAAVQAMARVRGTAEAGSPFQTLVDALLGRNVHTTGRDKAEAAGEAGA